MIVYILGIKCISLVCIWNIQGQGQVQTQGFGAGLNIGPDTRGWIYMFNCVLHFLYFVIEKDTIYLSYCQFVCGKKRIKNM